jgi:hypothetical protein
VTVEAIGTREQLANEARWSYVAAGSRVETTS